MDALPEVPVSVIYYGKNQPLPEQYALRAGPLCLTYERGAIRYVRLNEFEVIRMVYAAVRDQNWDTVDPVIKNERIDDRGDSFVIEFDAQYMEGEIHFVSRFMIRGSADGRIVFDMKGEAISSFKRNRIGFCVLHPLAECAGKDCEITTTDLKNVSGSFPDFVSAYQPFKDIRAMRWHLPGDISAQLDFEGDTFEMEDQRNWTDASFKTYCTPLELPFPVEIARGTTVQQTVNLTVNIRPELVDRFTPADLPRVFEIRADEAFPLPAIGIARSSVVLEMAREDLETLAQIPFDHYRTDIRLFQLDWQTELLTACREARHLKAKLEIALHLPGTELERELLTFIRVCVDIAESVYSISIFQAGEKTTPFSFLEMAVPLLRDAFPFVLVGAGTDAYFAELNRNRPDVSLPDFLTFSINPQVHAFDNASLTETLAAQADVVRSARMFSSGKGIHVSPVTLKPRFNPNATGPLSEMSSHAVPACDERQVSLFAAGWTLGSIKYLSEAGAKSLTYYETIGRRGLFAGRGQGKDPMFTPPYRIFPLYAVFRNILEYSDGEVLKSCSNKPLEFDGIVLRKNGKVRVIMANYLNKDSTITVPYLDGEIQTWQIGARNLLVDNWLSTLRITIARYDRGDAGVLKLTLQPYGLAIVDLIATSFQHR